MDERDGEDAGRALAVGPVARTRPLRRPVVVVDRLDDEVSGDPVAERAERLLERRPAVVGVDPHRDDRREDLLAFGGRHRGWRLRGRRRRARRPSARGRRPRTGAAPRRRAAVRAARRPAPGFRLPTARTSASPYGFGHYAALPALGPSGPAPLVPKPVVTTADGTNRGAGCERPGSVEPRG